MTGRNNTPQRIYWKQWTQFVLTEFGQCEINEVRIVNRSRYFNTAFVIELRCTHEIYKDCVAGLVKRYDGYTLNFRAAERRVLGREYDYTIVFTKDPSDAENYYLDSEGVLRYFKEGNE